MSGVRVPLPALRPPDPIALGRGFCYTDGGLPRQNERAAFRELRRDSTMLNREQLLERITADPKVLVGKPTVRGLRISVEQILAALAAGVPVTDLLADYPELQPADIQAVLTYAAERVSEERVYTLAAA